MAPAPRDRPGQRSAAAPVARAPGHPASPMRCREEKARLMARPTLRTTGNNFAARRSRKEGGTACLSHSINTPIHRAFAWPGRRRRVAGVATHKPNRARRFRGHDHFVFIAARFPCRFSADGTFRQKAGAAFHRASVVSAVAAAASVRFRTYGELFARPPGLRCISMRCQRLPGLNKRLIDNRNSLRAEVFERGVPMLESPLN
jgi:hypothetical protein